MVVYKIVNDVNGKMYIGQTIQSIESRMSEHIDSAKKGSMNSIHQAIRQYGAEHFHIEVVTTATTREQLYQLEAYQKSFDQDIFIDNIHWYYGEPCAESIES